MAQTDLAQRSADLEFPGTPYYRVGMMLLPIALCVAVAATGLKFFAYRLTGSYALLSDASASFINAVAAGFCLYSMVLSAKPPDESHPYGHGKIEFFAAGFEGALIVLAGIFISVIGIRQMAHARALHDLEPAAFLVLIAGLLNLGLSLAMLRAGRRSTLHVLDEHGKAVRAEVLLSAGVLAGLAAIHITGWHELDGWIACVVGLYLLFKAFRLVRGALGGLMDESDPELLREIGILLQQHRKSLWIEAHRLRAWKSGQRVHVDFHLILPRDLPLQEVHREVLELENIFSEHFGGLAEILIHLDPCKEPECPVCSNDTCDLRSGETSQSEAWHWQELTRDPPRPEPESS